MSSLDLTFPASLEMDVVPGGISGIDHARLNQAFADLDQKINRLSKKVEAHRSYASVSGDPSHTDSRKCQMICKDLQGPAKLRCLKQCVRPVVKAVDLEELRVEFPIDMTRLDRDLHLRQNFERHQRAPETIADTDAEASLIADLYAMPLATAALPDVSWSRAMEVIKDDRFAAQRDGLVRNWKDRSESYSDEAQQELSRKINRHDTDDILLNTARKFQ